MVEGWIVSVLSSLDLPCGRSSSNDNKNSHLHYPHYQEVLLVIRHANHCVQYKKGGRKKFHGKHSLASFRLERSGSPNGGLNPVGGLEEGHHNQGAI